MKKNQTDEILDIVRGIASRMATKVELKKGLDDLESEFKDDLSDLKGELKADITRLETKVDNLIDHEVDKRGALEARVSTLEKKVASR